MQVVNVNPHKPQLPVAGKAIEVSISSVPGYPENLYPLRPCLQHRRRFRGNAQSSEISQASSVSGLSPPARRFSR